MQFVSGHLSLHIGMASSPPLAINKAQHILSQCFYPINRTYKDDGFIAVKINFYAYQ